jgi:transposase
VVVSPQDTGIASARAKTDKRDARQLASLLWEGELDAVWMPDERCRILRRRLAHREQLVRARTRSRNEIYASLQRRLVAKPPCCDLFGVNGRERLADVELPDEERESADAGMRHIEFLDAEIAQVEKLIAQQALDWPEILRLMTIPGVNVICAASFMAAVGSADRFLISRRLVAYARPPSQSITRRPIAHVTKALSFMIFGRSKQKAAIHADESRDRGCETPPHESWGQLGEE